jgi:competence protein ComEA
MPELSRSQLLVYGAIGVALLLVGARWVRSASADSGPTDGVESAVAPAAQEGSESDSSFAMDAGGGDVVVHVAGAVRDPGVYRLPAGARVADGVERAGGATAQAAVDGINLAARLADGQQVIVPATATGAAGVAAGATAASGAADGPISLGTATVEQLDTIEGIGPVTAQGIIEFRDEHGGLSSVEDLDEISGIGPATMDALRGALQP